MIINFPTKEHWRDPSRLEWIESGLASLKQVIHERQIRSIAIPPLGCGNGGLHWEEVRPLIVKALDDLEAVAISIYEPTPEYWITHVPYWKFRSWHGFWRKSSRN